MNNQLCIGSSNKLKERFKEHNDGKVKSTKRYKPWKLLYYEAFVGENLARIREKRLKYNGNAIRELKKRIGLSGAGFTLVELVIVLAVIAILSTLLFIILDPAAQLRKANDALRKHDIAQIRSALDIYYNDHSCYPSSIPFGQTWKEDSTVYMPKVPQDPNYPQNAYVYEVDTLNPCPQEVSLFSNFVSP